jgi:hypothetical protein
MRSSLFKQAVHIITTGLLRANERARVVKNLAVNIIWAGSFEEALYARVVRCRCFL